MKKRFAQYAVTMSAAGLIFASPALAQDASFEGSVKIERYHKLLLKKPESASLFGRFFDSWLDSGTSEELQAFLEKRVEEDGAAGWRLLSVFHVQQGNDEEALKSLKKAFGSDGQSADLQMAMAKLQARLLQFDAAVKTLSELKAENAELKIEAARLSGLYLARSGQPEKAVAIWNEALKQNPDDEDLMEDMIELQVAEGLYVEALATAEILVKRTRDPYEKALREMRAADVQLLAGERKKAIARYSALLDTTGEGSWIEREVLAQIEQIFRREDDIAGLKEHFGKLRESQPRRVSLRRHVARLLAADGEVEEAIEMYREILLITPGDTSNRESFVNLLADNDRLPEAIKEMEALIKLKPDTNELLLQLAGLHEKNRDKDNCRLVLDRFVELISLNEAGKIRAARIYKKFHYLEASESVLRQTVKENPESKDPQEALASFLADNKKEKEALEIWLSMAKGAGADDLLAVARSLSAHSFREEAYTLLKEHSESNRLNSIYLAELIRTASFVGKGEKVIEEGLQLVALAKTPTDMSSALDQSGRLILRSKKGDEVIDSLKEKAVKTLADYCLLAELLEDRGESKKADAAIEEAAKIGDGLIVQSQRVRLRELRGDYVAAAKAMKILTESKEGRKPLYIRRLVDIYVKAGDYPSALKTTKSWKELSPGDKNAWIRHAELLSESGESEKGVHEMRRAVAKFGDDIDMKSKLAGLYSSAGETEAASRLYWRLYEEADSVADKAKWAGSLAQVAQMEGSLNELVENFEERKRSNRKSVSPLLALAEVHRVADNYESRRTALMEAHRRRPEDIKLLSQIAGVEERAGEFDRAAAILKQAMSQDPTGSIKRDLARLYLRNGEVELGMRLLAEINTSMKDPRGAESTVKALVDLGEWDSALQFLVEIRKTMPSDWRLSYLYAVAMEEYGEEKQAATLFLDLLNPQEELKNLKVSQQLTNWMQYRGQQFEGMDRETKEFMILSQVSRMAYTYKQQNRGYGNGQGITIPHDRETLKQFSISHLANLVEMLEEKEAKIVTQSVIDSGFPHFEMLNRVSESMYQGRHDIEFANELLKKTPLKPLHAMVALSVSGYGQGLEKDKLQKIFETFKETSPRVATQVANHLMNHEPERINELAEYMISQAEVQNPDKQQINDWQILQLLSGQMWAAGGEVSIKVSDEIKARALSYVQKRLVALKKKGGAQQLQAAQWLQTSLVSHSLDSKQYEAFVSCVNEVIAEHKKSPKSTSRTMNLNISSFSHGRGSGQMRFMPPVYPPAVVKEVPAFLCGYFPNSSVVPFNGRFGNNQQNREIDKAEMLKVVSKINSPYLQILIYQYCGETEKAEKLLKELLSQEDVSTDLHYLAAGFEFHIKKNHEAALKHVIALRSQPARRSQHESIDLMLVGLAKGIANDKDKSLSEEALEVAQQASLRLRRKAKTLNDQHALALAMRSLGLESAADKLTAANKRTGVRVNPSLSSRGGRGSQNSYEKVSKLLQDGKKEAASREAVRSLKSAMSQGNTNRWETERLVETVKASGLTNEVLKKFNPGNSTSVKRRFDYAKLAIMFDEKELAQPILKALHKDRPRDNEVTISLAVLLKDKKEREALLSELKEIDDSVAKGLHDKFRNASNDDFDEWMDAVNLYTNLLNSLEPKAEAKRNLSFVNYFAKEILTDSYVGGVSMPTLLANETKKLDEKIKESYEKRNQSFVAICEAMIRHPQTSEQGFILISKAAKKLKISDEKLAEYAQSAIRPWLDFGESNGSRNNRQNNRSRFAFFYQGGSSSSGNDFKEAMTPMPFLVSYVSEQGDVSMLKKIVEETERASVKKENLVSLIKVVESGKDNYAKELRKWLDDLETEKDRREQLPALLSLVQRLEIHDDLLLTKIEEIVLKSLKSSSGYNINTTQVEAYLSVMRRMKGSKALADSLVTVSEALLGEKKTWEDLKKQATLIRSRGSGRHAQNFYRFNQLCRALLASKDTGYELLKHLQKYELHRLGDIYTYEVINVASSNSTSDPEAFLKYLRDYGFLRGAKDFDPIYSFDDRLSRYAPTALGSVVDRLSNSDTKIAKAAFALKGDEALAGAAIAMILRKKDETYQIGFLDRLVAEKKAIDSWSPEQVRSVSYLLERVQKEGGIPKKYSKALAKLMGVADEKRKAEVQKLLTEVENAPPNLMQDYNFRRRVERVARDMIEAQPERAADIWIKYLGKLRDWSLATGSNGGTSNGVPVTLWDSQMNEILNNLRGKAVSTKSFLKFITKVEASEFNQYFTKGTRMNSEMMEFLGQAFRSEMNKIKKGSSSEKATKLLSKTLSNANEWSPEMMDTWCSSIAQYIVNNGPVQNDEAKKFVKKSLDDFKGVSAANIALLKTAISSRINRDDDEMKTMRVKLWSDFLTNEEVSLERRLSMALAYSNQSGFSEKSMRGVLAQHMVEASSLVKKGYPLGYQTLSMLEKYEKRATQDESDLVEKVYDAYVDSLIITGYGINGSSGNDRAIPTAIKLSLKISDETKAAKMVKRHGLLMRGNTKILVNLINRGQISLAKILLPTSQQYLNLSDARYTVAVESSLDELLADVGSPEHKFYLRTVLQLLEDDSVEKNVPKVKKKERVQSICQDSDFSLLKKGIQRLQVLWLLSKISNIDEATRKLVVAEAKKVDLSICIVNENNGFSGSSFIRQMGRDRNRYQKGLAQKAADLATRQGDASVLVTQLSSLARLSSNSRHNYEVRRSVRELLKLVIPSFLKAVHDDLSAESLAEFMPAADHILKIAMENQNFSDHYERLQAYLFAKLIYAANDRVDDFKALKDGLKSGRAKKNLERINEMATTALYNSFQRGISGWSQKGNKATRIALMKLILKSERVSQFLINSREGYRKPTWYGLEELVRNKTLLADEVDSIVRSVKLPSQARLAKLYSGAGYAIVRANSKLKEVGKALVYEGKDMAKESGDAKAITECSFSEALYLYYRGHPDQAAEIFKTFKVEDFESDVLIKLYTDNHKSWLKKGEQVRKKREAEAAKRADDEKKRAAEAKKEKAKDAINQ